MLEVWIIIFLILLAIEFFTVNLVSIWFAVGALFASIISYFTDSLTIQIAVFLVISTIALLLTKPLVKKFIQKEKVATNLDMVIDNIGIVTETITKLNPGEVKVNGKRWTAISSEDIKENSKVKILAIDGVKLIVQEIKEVN